MRFRTRRKRSHAFSSRSVGKVVPDMVVSRDDSDRGECCCCRSCDVGIAIPLLVFLLLSSLIASQARRVRPTSSQKLSRKFKRQEAKEEEEAVMNEAEDKRYI